jgi:uncharacterized protein (DUF1778 family)
MWYRVFAAETVIPDPASIKTCLAESTTVVRCAFAADESGWYRADLTVDDDLPLTLERYLADEEGIRAELNSWAAYLETLDHCPAHQALMERAIQTRQLFTLHSPDEQSKEMSALLCQKLCRHVATVTNGFFQVDEAGFFAADGRLLARAQ